MIGIDEVGRGAWAGPLLVCAARLKKPIKGLKDSKQLTPKKRQELNVIICQNADLGYGWVDAATIDDIGLAAALILAATIALNDISPQINEEVIVDGFVNYVPDLNSKAVIKADQNIAAVSAASIAAKVARDEFLHNLDNLYPEYGFKQHVGYGTKQHKEAIEKQGLLPIHRKSFNIKLV
jgi:ribonuclease HII